MWADGGKRSLRYFYIRNGDGFGSINLPENISAWVAAFDNGKPKKECELLRYDISLTKEQWDMLDLGEPCAKCAEFQRTEGYERCIECIGIFTPTEPDSIPFHSVFVADSELEERELALVE